MPYKIEVRPLAAIEIIEAYDWYELQREGLGIEFLESLEDFYKVLSRIHNITPTIRSRFVKEILTAFHTLRFLRLLIIQLLFSVFL